MIAIQKNEAIDIGQRKGRYELCLDSSGAAWKGLYLNLLVKPVAEWANSVANNCCR